MPETEESALVQRAKNGDFTAFEQLVMKHERALYTLARGIVRNTQDAEEVLQETFASVLEHLPQLRDESSFTVWLRRIATNQALKLLRQRKLQAAVPLEEPPDSGSGLPHPEFIARWRDEPSILASRNEVQQILALALEELEEKYRVVFILRDVEGFSTAEVAQMLHLAEGNVKIRLLRARLMLRERLTRQFGDEAARLAPHQHD